jgi:hypothetical protein
MTEIILYLSRTDRHETSNELSQIPEIKSTAKSLSSCSLRLSILILLSAFLLQTAAAEDGAALHEENCIACHAAMTGGEGTVLYTRDDHAVKSSDALTKQVNRCQSSLGLGWSNAQINSVQQYLNQSFYKF